MEAGIPGAKVAGSILEVQHTEVGVLAGNADANGEVIRRESAQVRQQGVKAVLEQSFGSGFSWDCHCRCIAVYISRCQLDELPLRLSPIKLQALDEFILQDVLPTLIPYTQSVRTVPDGLWLLGMLSYLHAKKMLA